MRGKFIVLYGINNLGKSTQAKLLVERLEKEGHKAEYIKYPIYNLEPSGTLVNDYLRSGNPFNLSAREIQIIYVLNRQQFEPTVQEKLNQGITIIAEDYIAGGIAWGIGTGVEETFMKKINEHLLKEDMSFLFDGERFVQSTEESHKHETNNVLLDNVRNVYTRLAREYGWTVVDANKSIDEIHEMLWKKINEIV